MNFIKNETAQKLRGGYYTPTDLAVFLARWIKEIHPKRVLEPSCGDGTFFSALAEAGGFSKAAVTGFELNEYEAAKSKDRAQQVGLKRATIHSGDFLGWALTHMGDESMRFDAVVGNPPFIRYQYLPPAFQTIAEEIFEELKLPFTKHTNAWVPFILASISLLRPGGRLAMVVPAEIIHVMHAQSLRSHLGRECRRLVVVDPEEIWFPETLQGAVLLLAEKRTGTTEKLQGLGIYPVRGRSFLNLNPTDVFNAPQAINGKTVAGKWTRAILDSDTRALFDEISNHREVHRFKDVAQVDVGIVTGANKYFLVTNEVVDRYKLSEWAHPMFGRSDHCPGIIYDKTQHETNARAGLPTNFLWFHGEALQQSSALRAYIEEANSSRFIRAINAASVPRGSRYRQFMQQSWACSNARMTPHASSSTKSVLTQPTRPIGYACATLG